MSSLINNKKVNKTQKKAFIDSIVQALVKLDKALSPRARRSSGVTSEALPEIPISGSQLKAMYTDFIKKFIEVGELEDNVFVYSVALAKKVVHEATKDYAFKKGEFILIYSACLYLSIKMLIDEERWFLADFSYVSGLEESHIEKMELFVLSDILKFSPKLSDEVFAKEKKELMRQRRRNSGVSVSSQ